MAFEDILGGALSGGAAGAPAGPWGAGIGAGAGALFGGFMGNQRDAQNALQRQRIDQAMAKLGATQQASWRQRMGDMDKIMSFYGPANDQLQRMYGTKIPIPTMSGTQFGGG